MAELSFHAQLRRLIEADAQSRSARTVELFGWLIFCESLAIVFFPSAVMALLGGGDLSEQAASLFRLVGVLVGGLGMLYIVSGRLNAAGFTFASLLDRPLVPPLMAVLWYLGILPGGLAAAFAIQDFAGFLWTLNAWRRERRAG